MPYKRIEDLPESVRAHLPVHAQEIFLKAFDSAFEEYADPKKRRGDASQEETAFRVAWAAVKEVYVKDEKTGEWEKK